MNFTEYKDRTMSDEDAKSAAEVLAAMDCLMHHMSDEEECAYWMSDCVPDDHHWDVLRPDDYRRGFYEDLAGDMTYGEYEDNVRTFANAIYRQCFRLRYSPRSLA